MDPFWTAVSVAMVGAIIYGIGKDAGAEKARQKERESEAWTALVDELNYMPSIDEWRKVCKHAHYLVSRADDYLYQRELYRERKK